MRKLTKSEVDIMVDWLKGWDDVTTLLTEKFRLKFQEDEPKKDEYGKIREAVGGEVPCDLCKYWDNNLDKVPCTSCFLTIGAHYYYVKDEV